MGRRRIIVGIMAVVVVLVSIQVRAEDAPTPQTASQSGVPAWAAGFGGGLGLSLTVDRGKHKRVEKAEVVNGIVRVTSENNNIPRVLVEVHRLFGPCPKSRVEAVKKGVPPPKEDSKEKT